MKRQGRYERSLIFLHTHGIAFGFFAQSPRMGGEGLTVVDHFVVLWILFGSYLLIEIKIYAWTLRLVRKVSTTQ